MDLVIRALNLSEHLVYKKQKQKNTVINVQILPDKKLIFVLQFTITSVG